MENNFILTIIPAAIEKGGIAKIRLVDSSEEQGADRKFVVYVDDQPNRDLLLTESQYSGAREYLWNLDTTNLVKGGHSISIRLVVDNTGTPPPPPPSIPPILGELNVYEALDGIYHATSKIADKNEIGVALKPTDRKRTPDLPLWVSILQSTKALSYENYSKFMDIIFCGPKNNGNIGDLALGELRYSASRRFLPFTDTDSYRSLKAATEAFVMTNCGVALNAKTFDEEQTRILIESRGFNLDDSANAEKFQDLWDGYLKEKDGQKIIPYLYLVREKLKDIPLKKHTLEHMLELTIRNDQELANIDETTCFGVISEKLSMPCFLELIWSYWHEESMMVQGMNALSRRFQNVRNPRGNDPLAGIEINPLQPLNNLLWGYIQDEQHRLSVVRRAYEYDHHYGISIQGKAIKDFSPADSRSRFLEAFHQLLYLCAQFYKQEDDLTIQADAFPIRNALREVHLILSEGAHNQYGDMPSTARIEMLMQQYILARPEFRQVLPTRVMVAYPEPWMDRVNAINHLMGWTKSSPIHFANLGIFGEQLLLSIRFGSWSYTDTSAQQAAIWANFWRQAVQEYIHAYYAVTGVELGATRVNNERIDSRPPSFHLAERAKASSNGSSNGYINASANGKSTVY